MADRNLLCICDPSPWAIEPNEVCPTHGRPRETAVADGAADPLADEVQRTLVFIGDRDGTMPVRIYRDHTARLLAALDAERAAREAAEAAIARARALHRATREDGVLCGDPECETCLDGPGHDNVEVCSHCWVPDGDGDGYAVYVYWPCPTAAALETETP